MSSERPGGLPESPSDPSEDPALEAARIEAYLRSHPSFLVEHPELLDVLLLPARAESSSSSSKIVDFQQVQLTRCRREVEILHQACTHLVEIGRENALAQQRVHQAVLRLFPLGTLEELLERIVDELTACLGLDSVTLCLEEGNQSLLPPATAILLPAGKIAQVLGEGGRVRLLSAGSGDLALFGPAAPLIRSQALLRLTLGPRKLPALLCLGSHQENLFHETQGTDLLQFLAGFLERILSLRLRSSST